MAGPKVFVMMSGGVDSSVAASVLLEQGYEVVGVFMKCWSVEQLDSLGVERQLYGCFWEEDSQDARLVAGKLGIPFYVWDFQEEYKSRVVDYMLREYAAGRTPNPDVMCNSTIKFGIFYETAKKLGADFVATGHYARIKTFKSELENQESLAILRGLDENKDQSYFLWRVRSEQLRHVLFPIGEFENKAKVRAYAEKHGLLTAHKPDSQGLCFIGTTPLRELLLQTLGQKEGQIIDSSGRVLGTHPGAYLYTIGQREKLGLAGGPWYVSQIKIEQNQVVVSHGHQPENLMKKTLVATDLNWQINTEELQPLNSNSTHQPTSFTCQAQIRYRQPPEKCQVHLLPDNQVQVEFDEPVRAVSSGQSIVFYDGQRMLGGGVIQ
jgi:tRNA-uridine 2-sulfurtransferase